MQIGNIVDKLNTKKYTKNTRRISALNIPKYKSKGKKKMCSKKKISQNKKSLIKSHKNRRNS